MSSHPFQAAKPGAEIDWRDLEELLDELAVAARSAIAPVDFYRLLLARLAPAAGAGGASLWLPDGSNGLRLAAQVGRDTATPCDSGTQPSPAIEGVARSGAPQIVSVHADAISPHDAQNSSEVAHVLHPVPAAGDTRGVVALSYSGEIAAATGRSCLRLLAAVAELVDEFHRHGELERLRDRELRWQPFEQFGLRVHRSLDPKTTAYAIVNDGRLAIDCDRLSVLVRSGKRCRLLATSGVDVIDARSPAVQAIEKLASACLRAEEPLWYSDGALDLPPEIEQPLQAHLDQSHARSLAVVPLVASTSSNAEHGTSVGVLVAEQFQSSADDGRLRERVTAVADHAALALANSLAVSRQPLARLSRAIARIRWLAEARQLPKTVLALMAIAAAIAALALVPADFDLEARGELLPKLRREVFATDSGVIGQLSVDHAQQVKADEPLLVIRKPELDLEFRRVAGEMQTAEKKLASIQAERLENASASAEARRRVRQLAADEEELKEQLKGLREQYAILEKHRQDLVVRSPINGEAITWNIKELLEARPVERGQALLTVADLAGPWELELHLGDYRAGHLLAAREELRPELDVTFALLSEPGVEYHGTVSDVAAATELDNDGRPIVRVTVDFDRDMVSALRTGATAVAHIHCGRRAIGYVWLHDLFEFVQSHWWW